MEYKSLIPKTQIQRGNLISSRARSGRHQAVRTLRRRNQTHLARLLRHLLKHHHKDFMSQTAHIGHVQRDSALWNLFPIMYTIDGLAPPD